MEERELKFQEYLKQKEEQKRAASEKEMMNRKRKRRASKEDLEETSGLSPKEEETSPTQMQVIEEIFGE